MFSVTNTPFSNYEETISIRSDHYLLTFHALMLESLEALNRIPVSA